MLPFSVAYAFMDGDSSNEEQNGGENKVLGTGLANIFVHRATRSVLLKPPMSIPW